MKNFNEGSQVTRYTVAVEPSASIDFLNTVVIAETEPDLGPLVAIGNDGKSTILTFQYANPVPTERTSISRTVGGLPDVSPDRTLVCTGTIFDAGELRLCAGTR